MRHVQGNWHYWACVWQHRTETACLIGHVSERERESAIKGQEGFACAQSETKVLERELGQDGET